ncbi:MAG: hypothetical protein ABFD79_01855 [Phycisphaerales bacterium]
MSEKMKTVSIIIAILTFVTSVHAYNYYICNQSGNWADPNIWQKDCGVPQKEPSQVLIYGGVTIDVNSAGQYMWDGGIGYNATSDLQPEYAKSGATVNIANGVEFRAFTLVVGHMGGIGIVNINGKVICDWNIRIGTGNCKAGTSASGTINVNDGGMLIIGGENCHFTQEIGEGCLGFINLKGKGCMIVNGDGGWHLDLNGGRGHIDIEEGFFKVLGDYRKQIQEYIDYGWITSHRGLSDRYSLEVSFYEGYTYVKTIDHVLNIKLSITQPKPIFK